jgi:hypothetical protein
LSTVAEAGVTIGGSSVVSTGAGIGGGAILGISSLAFGVIGLALVVVSVVYNLIMGRINETKINRMMRSIRREIMRNTGVELIDNIYGMAIPGWRFGFEKEENYGEYVNLGGMFTAWSKSPLASIQGKELGRNLARWLRDHGLDPTRFMGGDNVSDEDGLKIMEMWVALPERILISKEALNFLGYEFSRIDGIDNEFHIRMFDMIKSMGRVKTEDQAVLVKKDIEDWLISRSLDPKIFFGKATNTLPSPTNSAMTVSPTPALLPGEQAEREAISESGISPIILIGIAIGAIFVFSSRKMDIQ